MPAEALQEAKDPLVPAEGHKVSIGIYGDSREWMGTDGIGRKQTQTQAESEGNNYLQSQDYD